MLTSVFNWLRKSIFAQGLFCLFIVIVYALGFVAGSITLFINGFPLFGLMVILLGVVGFPVLRIVYHFVKVVH